MKKIFPIIILIFIINVPCQSQDLSIENQLQNCLYESFTDGGKSIKKEINKFEKFLIDKNILGDRSGKSYIEIYRKIIEIDDINFDINYSFRDSIQKLQTFNMDKIIDCQTNLLNSSKFYNSKPFKLKTVLDSISEWGNISPSIISKGILSVLDKEDFELEYYKFKALVMLDVTNSNISLSKKWIKPDIEQYKNPFKIHLNGENQILVNNEIVTVQILKESLRNYEKSYKSKSVIIFKVKRNALYKNYIEIQSVITDEIEDLRRELSFEKHNVDLDKLDKVQLAEIKNIYPRKIIEIE